MARIIYTRPDGGMDYIVPVEGTIEHILANQVPEAATDVHVVEDDALPTDFTFLDAWRNQQRKVVVNMPKARDVWRDRIRRARAPLLTALDVDYQRADERGDAAGKRAIAAQKQALRDAPADPAIEAAGTIDALKAVWPLPAGMP